MINGIVDTISSKPSYLDNSSCSFKAGCWKNGRCCNVHIPQLDPINRYSMSTTRTQNEEDDEPSASADEKSPKCHTPTESKFDPLVTGPDYSALYAQLRRMRNHDLASNSEETSLTDSAEDRDAERNLFEQIFSSLIELIISSKLKELITDDLVADPNPAEEWKTPTDLPLLTGLADTCPPAPMRRPMSVKGFDHSICRKLDFESSLI